MSIRRMTRELGIHRDTVRRYIDAKSPPTRRSPVVSTVSPSDTIADQTGDISAEQLDGVPLLLVADIMTRTSPTVSKAMCSLILEEPTRYTEAALMKDFTKSLHRRLRSHGVPSRILLPELDGIQGRPDLVDANIQALPEAVGLDVLATSLTSPTKARLLAILRYGAPRRREYLERFTGLSNHSLEGHIRQLEKVGLVEVHRNSAVSLQCPLPWDMVRIETYEGKLTNWRRALHQAIGYRSFSNFVWVVMPVAGARSAKKVPTAFHNNGIGLIAIEDDGSANIEIRSKTRRHPASRRLYLMAVGAVLNRFVEERRRLHRRIRPESIQRI